ncbi:MAG TPA: hypothetical protein PLB05_01015 [Candidatus Omnitrophota bacterium]|nr:hypothetical protein [Candidatus Omnitrophota bacterium]HPN56539.1 hypothetical protein [Candidatus Omnitrophota bacterium]
MIFLIIMLYNGINFARLKRARFIHPLREDEEGLSLAVDTGGTAC